MGDMSLFVFQRQFWFSEWVQPLKARPEKTHTACATFFSYVCWHVKPGKYIIYMNCTTIVDIAGELLRGITVSQIVFCCSMILAFFSTSTLKVGRRLNVPSPIYQQNQNSAKRKEIRIRCSHDLYSKIFRFTSTTIMVFRVSPQNHIGDSPPPQTHPPKNKQQHVLLRILWRTIVFFFKTL